MPGALSFRSLSIGEILFLAIGLDLLLGDPRWFPHPVKLIGRLARALESATRARIGSPLFAGVLTSTVVYGISFAIPFFTVKWLASWSPLAGDLLSAFWIYTTIALRDLIHHSFLVYRALRSSDLEESRRRVGMIVGRDTKTLSEAEIVRACVESVSESLVDGITAPILFGAFGGPAWAILYRSINTLDSLFGHRDERYEWFGKFAARVDDLANFVPARVTSPLVALSSAFLGLHPIDSLRILFRDGRKHPSPNAGLSEAAVAGALGVRLGGDNYYDGIRSVKPFLGDARETLSPRHIVMSNRLVFLTSLVVAAAVLFLRKMLYVQFV